jgi:hypothetical protein
MLPPMLPSMQAELRLLRRLEAPLSGNVKHIGRGECIRELNPKTGETGKRVVQGLLYDTDQDGFSPRDWPVVIRAGDDCSRCQTDERTFRCLVRANLRPTASPRFTMRTYVNVTLWPTCLQVESSRPGHPPTEVVVKYPPSRKPAAIKRLLGNTARAVMTINASNAGLRENDGHLGKMSGSGQHLTHEG